MSARPLVLVVDDDESIREAFPDLLRQFGFEAEAFASGHELLASQALDRADAFVFDVVMPQINGFELLQQVRQRGRSTPVVFITARADPATRARTLAAGAVACLIKPVSPSALLEALRAAVPGSE